jgi:predicted ArsR family transcriptional regulator
MSDERSSADLAALRLLDEPVRRRLYEWVVRQPEPVGREQAAAAAGVSRGLATFHLDKLAQAGMLEASYRRLSGKVGPGAGRPARVYWRAEREFSVTVPERRYARAANLFAAALERLSPSGGPPPALVDEAHALGSALGQTSKRGSGRTRLLKALEQGGYEPFMAGHGVIRLRNCPFDALAQSHRPLVCGTNLALAEGIVASSGAAVEPILDPQPGYCCVAFREAADV